MSVSRVCLSLQLGSNTLGRVNDEDFVMASGCMCSTPYAQVTHFLTPLTVFF